MRKAYRTTASNQEREGDFSEGSLLDMYLREIDKAGLLNPEEEKDMARRIQRGETEARGRMIEANLRLAVSIARSRIHRGLGLPDLIQEGNIGVIYAAERFDAAFNTRFSTYASHWIKKAISLGLAEGGKTIRLPVYMLILLNKGRHAAHDLQMALERAPTPDEVAAYLGLKGKTRASFKKALRTLNFPPQDNQWEEESPAFNPTIVDTHTTAPDAQLEEREEHQKLARTLEQMDQREATVLRLRFGLDNEEPRTLKQIGVILGLTRERVRQIESKALSHLRERMLDTAPMHRS